MTHWQPLASLSRTARQGQTYRNILYLLVAFPLGLTYFVVLVTGLSTAIGLAIIIVGLVLVWLTFAFAWAMAAFERYLTTRLLRVEIAPVAGPGFPYRPGWRAVVAHLRRPITWKSLLYLFLEFPFGVVSFTLTITLLAVSLSLLLYPLGFLIGLAVTNGVTQVNNVNPFSIAPFLWQYAPHPVALILDGLLFLLVPAIGVALTTASLYALNAMAYGWGQFARLMLGMSAAERQLAAAQMLAAQEQARAEHADQRRRELIVNISHELRTPIANISGHIESLRTPMAERLSEADKQRYLAIVAREAERLSALIDDLLALARADAHELHLDLRPVNVGLVVEEVYQSLAPLAHRDRQVTLVRTIAPDLPYALADRGRLAQVLLNLARNAITATPVGGLVFLDLERADAGHISLAVSDTGQGIAPDDLDRIFERFYRVDAARGRATGGFGLGLSIVRDLVEAMGGEVTASSTLGVGSRFQVLLPVAVLNTISTGAT